MLFMDDPVGVFCHNTAGIWGILGWIVLILRIVIPLVLIVLGMIDMGKAVIEDDEKAIGTAVGKLVRRFIAALLVFFIPLIVSMLFNAFLPSNYEVNISKEGANQCVQCLLNRSGTEYSCVAPYME